MNAFIAVEQNEQVENTVLIVDALAESDGILDDYGKNLFPFFMEKCCN